MANHYRVSPKFWLWARRRGLTDAQTTLALYLLTCEHRNLEGLYRLPRPYISADLGWAAKKTDEAFAAVLSTGFAAYDEGSEVLLIPKALKHQQPSTENQIKGAIAQLARIPRTSLWDGFRIACASHCPKLSDAIEERWPSDSDAPSRVRAGSGAPASSSSSNSISKPPQPPASGGSEEQGGPSGGEPKNSRAHGTNLRAVAGREKAAAAQAVAAALAEPSPEQREAWSETFERLMARAPGTWRPYLARIRLAGASDGLLVIDSDEVGWTWLRANSRADKLGPGVRLATQDEHVGLAVTA